MRSLLLAAIILAILSAAAFCSYRQTHDFVSNSRYYRNIQEAAQGEKLANGWLPNFLPQCATNIFEKHNSEQNIALAAFHFEGTNCVNEMLKNAEELPAGILRTVKPRAIGTQEKWFPKAILQGDSEILASAGFKFYRIPQSARIGDNSIWKVWYLAVNPDDGFCALWYREQLSLENGIAP